MISRIIGLILLILLAPFFLLFSLIVYIDDGFPVIYKQKRIGVNNSIFWVYKYRTMKKNTPDIPTHLLKNPELVYTKYGKLLRKFSIDELPQLINIIKGEMVFVGPRPPLHNEEDLAELRTRDGIQELVPGLTGWAQVNGRDELSIIEKVKFDKYYLNNRSIIFDIKILILTILQVIRLKGISH